MTYTLGVSAFFHDAAAALVRDGEIIAASQEERFSRIKHDASFPISAINYCLEEGGIDGADLHSVVFYEKPLWSFDRIIASFQSAGLKGYSSWLKAAPKWIGEKFHIAEILKNSLGVGDHQLNFVPHHLSHAAAAFYPSPFDDAAILTIDGVGEWATATIGVGEGSHIELIEEMRFPDSLGLLYSAFTQFCGFKVNSGEYKLMGLAPYGRPSYLDIIEKNIAQIKEDGSVSLNPRFFRYVGGPEMTSRRFAALFGGERRQPESRITRREIDLAASIQAFTEQAVLKMAARAKSLTNQKKLCLAGGVGLNCVANGHLLRSGLFEDIWIQPAAGDGGSALGAALAIQHALLKIPRPKLSDLDRQKGSYLGPAFSEAEVEAYLESYEIPYVRLPKKQRAGTVAQALAKGQIVGLFNGRMEFGPRALGARSILGDPRNKTTQSTMNLRIKYRESFRPFAPAVLAGDVKRYFELDRSSPYMLLVAPVSEDIRAPRKCDEVSDDDLLSAVNQVRSLIPAVTHWDYSARIQTVHRETNPLFHEILSAFKKQTGVGVLVNTSFNVRGEPIVCTPADAYRCFMRTEMDFLYMEGFWMSKAEQPTAQVESSRETKIELD